MTTTTRTRDIIIGREIYERIKKIYQPPKNRIF